VQCHVYDIIYTVFYDYELYDIILL